MGKVMCAWKNDEKRHNDRDGLELSRRMNGTTENAVGERKC